MRWASSNSAEAGLKKPRFNFAWSAADTSLFFSVYYLYVWLIIDPRLIHHSLGILHRYYPFSFHAGWAFFGEHLGRPGGFVEYFNRLLSQYFAIGWTGAGILTTVAIWSSLAVDAMVRRAGGGRGRVLRFVPAVILLSLWGGYSHPLGAVLAMLFALSVFLLYVRYKPQHGGLRLAAAGLSSVALCYLAGPGGMLFPILVAVDEAVVGRRLGLASGVLLFGLAVPWIIGWWAPVDFPEAYRHFLFSDPGTLPGKWLLLAAFGVAFPAILAAIVIARGGWARRASQQTPKRSKRTIQPGSRLSPGIVRWGQTGSVLFAAGIVAWLTLDTFSGAVLEIDYHSQGERWAEVLTAAERLPTGTYHVRCHRNIVLALYHEGRLGDALFHYAMRPGVDLFATPANARDLGSYYQESRLFLELGHINQAEKGACEALETCGQLPAVLEELALINVVKGRSETAATFLNALARNPFHRRNARQWLDQLEADSEMRTDPLISRLRENMVARDYVAMDTSIEEFLQVLLEKNPRNRMAFELLMTHYLVIGRPDEVVANLSRLENFDYSAIPRHYQEAAAIYGETTGKQTVVPGFELDAAVFRQARQFRGILGTARSREDAARTARAAGFGDTYFFYLTFGSG